MAFRTGKLFDVDRITRHFYEHFQAAHAQFLSSIQGITDPTDREWYASLTLNRLMFVYFLQKKGFLDHNTHYLPAMLKIIQDRKGKNAFFSFYRHFLLHLFHQEQATAASDLQELLSNIPYLNGNLLTLHELEREHTNVQIPDEAFERLFAFFDSYQWCIDEQSPCNEHEINPDVIGYIFEKYINQKQMGAYYTKDDITEYISKNTVIPYILYTIQQAPKRDGQSEAPIWQLLRADPDRYIPASIRQAGYLPTETEREYAERRQRYAVLKTKLAAETSLSISDLITCNLDLCQLALDIIHTAANPSLLRTFYRCLQTISILDPTCGSGAFLFAALNILTPLYVACLERMQEMITYDDKREQPNADDFHRQDLVFFREILRQADDYPDRTCFILKEITHNNLYGVDIMKEAVEICKLRLFLKLVARLQHVTDITALSSINFNIRAGNTLVGFVHAYEVERTLTSPLDFSRPNALQAQLDIHLARAYSIDSQHIPEEERYITAFQRWKESHQPFHWFLEFPAIMQRGGFDIIIGNPPYVEYSKVRQTYKVQGYETESCGNLYAAVIERSFALCRPGYSFLGCIVPLSICGSERFHQLRRTIMQHTSAHWLSNFEIFPCRLFDGAFQRLSILLARHKNTSDTCTFVTKIQRWYASERPHLIDLIFYTPTRCSINAPIIPKLASPLQECILQKVLKHAGGQTIATILSPHPTDHFVYYQEATNYWMKATCRVPYYKKNGVIMVPPHGRFLYFLDPSNAHVIMAIMNSSLFYLWFATYSDGFHLSHTLVKTFPVYAELYSQKDLLLLSEALEQNIKLHARLSTRNTRPATRQNKGPLSIELEEYRMSYAKALIDEIDALLAQHYGFTQTELDFIVHYDSKYRMGKDDEDIHTL